VQGFLIASALHWLENLDSSINELCSACQRSADTGC